MNHVRSLGLSVLLLALAPAAALAQTTPNLTCQDSLEQDRQGAFTNAMLANASALRLTNDGSLQLDTNLVPLDPERIYFPFNQHVTISYVYESAGANHTLGYVYMRDLRARGYVDAAGNLVDANNNGVMDFHEDIYNLAPPSGTAARPYIGASPRCTNTFQTGGHTFRIPELASASNCPSNTFNASASYYHATSPWNSRTVPIVGAFAGDSPGANAFSDRGLFPRVPNLLEPPHADNGNRGLGNLVFLVADDDGDTSIYRNLAPVADSSNTTDGVPDYDVSRYDSRGLVRSSNPNPGISTFDRTVDLGIIPGDEEIVFFLVVYYDSFGNPPNNILPCLRRGSNGVCSLHLRSSTYVYFSKAAWNMDQETRGGNIVAERNIGCGYSESCTGPSSSSACRVNQGPGSGNNYCGWLDQATLNRLNTSAYNNLQMPRERIQVPRPPNGSMPHVVVGAPSTEPTRWILGFEDLPGGGDRDFNDVVFVINKVNGGSVRSGHMSGDISPEIADDFTITKVRFQRADDNTRTSCPGGAPCWTGSTPDACRRSPAPTIDYFVAVDCRVRSGADWVDNPTPSWVRVPFADPPDRHNPQTEIELDMLSLGLTGSQLCWRVELTSPDERCTPTVDKVEVGYQAVRAGFYTRSAPSTIGNSIVYGGYQTPGRKWGEGWPLEDPDSLPAPGTLLSNGRLDFSVRGQLTLQSLYDPEEPNQTNIVRRWSAGRALALASGDPLTRRRLYTTNGAGARRTVASLVEDGSWDSPLFPDWACDQPSVGGRDPYDLNGDGMCRTTTHVGKRTLNASQSDRHFFRRWLYGWENDSTRRPWPMDGVQHSTVNLLTPPYLDPAARKFSPAEQDQYLNNFVSQLGSRSTYAFVGTIGGMLHGFNSGRFMTPNAATWQDDCGHGAARGWFEPVNDQCGTATSPASRNYGDGAEAFAWLPRGLLDRYRNLYPALASISYGRRPSMDASPTIANVDFGISGQPAWTPESGAPSRNQGAKTVLASATGAQSHVLFALDITNPSRSEWPFPLWEYEVDNGLQNTAFIAARVLNWAVQEPDNRTSRHPPSIGRVRWGDQTRWVAAFASDYTPGSGTRAGTVFVMDLITGQPMMSGVLPYGGVITLEDGFGIAGPPVMVDIDRDGTHELLYVPSTSGKVWRINLTEVSNGRRMGRRPALCAVADAPAYFAEQDVVGAEHQQIHSNLAVRVIPGLGSTSVRFFFGTGDNPDVATDGPADRSNYQWHLMAWEDPDPLGACAEADVLWARPLDPGHAVWGGVMLTEYDLLSTSAVGRAADACNLSQTESGYLYVTQQNPDENTQQPVPKPGDRSPIGGHGISTPLLHDNHIFVLGAEGRPRMIGGDTWNNNTADESARGTRMLIWDQRPGGALPR